MLGSGAQKVIQLYISRQIDRWASPGGAVVKSLPATGMDLTPESGRSPGGGNGNPLQYSCLENTIDRGAWWAAVHGVTKTQILLSTAQSVQEIVKDREA